MIGTFLAEYMKSYEIMKIGREDFSLANDDFARKYLRSDVLINLSGAPVIRRWTKKNMQEIIESRIHTTRKLARIIKGDSGHKRLYISASAIGLYNDRDEHTEKSQKWGKGFMKEVVQAWEKEVRQLENQQTNICIIRIGIVLSPTGGMIKKLLPVFSLGMGARIGKGDQFFSWIHIEDLARAVTHIIEGSHAGVYNLTAPKYTTNRDLTNMLAGIMNKPALLAVPVFMLKLLYGRGAAAIIGGQAVIPERLINEGFRFLYPDLNEALKDIVD